MLDLDARLTLSLSLSYPAVSLHLSCARLPQRLEVTLGHHMATYRESHEVQGGGGQMLPGRRIQTDTMGEGDERRAGSESVARNVR